ncbi:hypothetical protein FACS1894191_5180 [Clostridia bacterium]|nr:hypothetical protein FACS1894191_5180 [Clostridia bacterium]
MASYIGVKCPVCNKKFDQADDIVVCPICGAPHHRECYALKNECAFVSEHMSGNVWQAPREQEKPEDEDSAFKKCPRCGAQIPRDALFCHICGQNINVGYTVQREAMGQGQKNREWPLPGMDFIGDPLYTVYGGVDPDDKIDEETVRDMAAYIGPSSAYYIPRFKEISEKGKTISPNFSAMLFSFFFYFYRKMYALGFIMLALYILSSVPGYLYSRETMPLALHEMQQMGFSALIEQSGIIIPPIESVDLARAEYYLNLSRITRFVDIVICVILSMCFNRLYCEKCLGSVRDIRAGGNRPEEGYRSALLRYGGINKAAPLVAGVSIAAGYFIINTVILYFVLGG